MRRLASLAVLFIASGCAGYKVQKDGQGSGYDVYRPDPYLLRTAITDSASGAIRGFQFSLVWLPNYSHRYRVYSWAGLGKADFTFTFTDGWKLTNIEDKGDNTAILSTLSDLTKHFVPAGLTGQPSEERGTGAVDLVRSSAIPVLYAIVFDEGTDCAPGTGLPTGLRQVCEFPCPGTSIEPKDIDHGLREVPKPTPPAGMN